MENIVQSISIAELTISEGLGFAGDSAENSNSNSLSANPPSGASQVSASENAEDEAQKEKEPVASEPASPAPEASEPAALEPEAFVPAAAPAAASGGIASYFFGSVIASQPVSLADPDVSSRDKFPSLPTNLNTQGTIVSTQGSTLNLQGTRIGNTGLPSPTSSGPTSPFGSPIVSSSAFSLPTSPSHPRSSPSLLFSPIVPAPGSIVPSPLAAPTPVLSTPSNPVIIPPVSNNMISSSIQSTAFSPTNPLFLPTAPFQTTVSPPNPPE